MDKNQSLMIASVMFGIIALMHLLRSIFSWPASIAGFDIPVWFSYLAVIVLGYMAWQMYSASKN